MDETTIAPAVAASATSAVEDVEVTAVDTVETLVEDELLVEEISIDGMCGVY